VVEPDTDLFTSLHEEVLLQQRIVDDLQDLALAEAGALTYHRTLLDVSDLLEISVAAHRPAAEAAGITLTTERSRDLPPIHADPDRLRQVLSNLISNAVRATPPDGRITLHASATASHVTITLSDTGTGIDPTALPHIFDRFWRADPARGRRTGGSGLGLAIARQIISDHRSAIHVDSELGTGTTFTITMPVGAQPSTVPNPATGTHLLDPTAN
jgi:two-component system sensor histidine kinase BaeS